MPTSDQLLALIPQAAPIPATPLGSFEDSAVSWLTWVTLMGFVGVTALSLISTGPAANRLNAATLSAVTRRLARAGSVFGALAVRPRRNRPAIPGRLNRLIRLTDSAH